MNAPRKTENSSAATSLPARSGSRTAVQAFTRLAALALFSFLFFSAFTAAQEDRVSDENIFFVDVPVYVASRTSQTEANAPAVLTIITREEIQNSGARDLGDILSMVPGFSPAKEVQNLLGYGVRGMWSLEGKMLIMIDGIQMNEILYGNPLFGASSFVDYIERIEIIRGPGSALYGGFGELAVINIITRDGDKPGTEVSTMYGQMAGAFGHRSLNVNSAFECNDVKYSLSAAVGDGHTSDRDFIDPTDKVFSLKDFGGSNGWFAKIGLNYKDLDLKFIGNSYVTQAVSRGNLNSATNLYDPAPVDFPLETRFTSFAVDTKYLFKLGDKLSLAPRLTYIESDAWRSDNDDPALVDYYLYHPTRQLKFNATAQYDFSSNIDLTLGGEYATETADTKALAVPFRGGNDVSYNTQSLFGEFMAKTNVANFTVGARYDKQSHFGGAFVPRFVVTKTLGSFNLKGLVSRSYRAPTILNIDYNPDIKPEYTNSIEAEATYAVNRNQSITLNVFDMRVEDVIVYSDLDLTYNNYAKTGSRGFDLSYKMREKWGYINLSYSYYRAVDNVVPLYVARASDGNINSDVLLGFPTHKAALSASYKAAENISVNPSILYLGQRYATYWSNAAGGDVNSILDPATLVNINIRATKIFRNLEIAFGVFNIFDSAYDIAPGYYQVVRPTPSYSREYTIKLTYNF